MNQPLQLSDEEMDMAVQTCLMSEAGRRSLLKAMVTAVDRMKAVSLQEGTERSIEDVVSAGHITLSALEGVCRLDGEGASVLVTGKLLSEDHRVTAGELLHSAQEAWKRILMKEGAMAAYQAYLVLRT